MNDILNQVTARLCEIGKLPAIGPAEDFYDAGFSSISALELLVQLETDFEISIPDDRFIAARTPESLCEIILQAREEACLPK